MATIRKRGDSYEVRLFNRGMLGKPTYKTFPTKEEAKAFAACCDGQLKFGVMPNELKKTKVRDLVELVRRYGESVSIAKCDEELWNYVVPRVRGVSLDDFNYQWVEKWVGRLQKEGLAASTINKRVGCLARAVDWGMRSELLQRLTTNPVRLLPRGLVTKHIEKEKLWAGERDRRLFPEEEATVRNLFKTLYGDELTEQQVLFDLALETGMRLSEMLALTWAQVDFGQRTIFLHRSKNGNRRQIPMSSVLIDLLTRWKKACPGKTLFMERGETLRATSSWWSGEFADIWKDAGMENFRFHDLRHEATSRFYEKTRLSDLEIASITGHKDLRMLRRYANLRGSLLSEKLW